MAKIQNNLTIHGLSGMLGKQVVVRRMKNGHYVLAAKPDHRSQSPTSCIPRRFSITGTLVRLVEGKR